MVGMVSGQATVQAHLLFVQALLDYSLCFTYTPLTGIPLPWGLQLGIDCSNPEVRTSPSASLLKGNTCPQSGSDGRGP